MLIWDDELGPSTRPFVAVPSTPSNPSIEQPKKYSSKEVIQEVMMSNVEGKPKKYKCDEVMEGMWDKKKEKMKLMVQEKQKMDWSKLLVIVSWVIFGVCYGKK